MVLASCALWRLGVAGRLGWRSGLRGEAEMMMTTAESRKFGLLKRQLNKSLKQAALCAKEIAKMVHGNGEHYTDGGKTQKRLRLDEGRFTVIWGNKTLRLGNTRGFWLLKRLACCLNRHVTHVDLLEIWGDDEFSDTARLRTAVRRLRVTLRQGGMGGLADAIVGHRGHYVLDVDEKFFSCHRNVTAM